MQSKILKLNLKKHRPDYTENYQSSSILFAPVYVAKKEDPLYKDVEGEYCQAWYPVRCRDKLNDLPNILKLGIEVMYINGFTFEYPEIFKDYGKKLRMSVSFLELRDQEAFVKNFKLFTDFESKYKLKKSKINKTNIDNTFIITSDIFWTKTPLHISLYSFLLRTLSYGVLTDLYFKRFKQLPDLNTIEDLLSLIKVIFKTPYIDSEGIDGNACELLLEPETSLDSFMSALPFITSKESITGYCDEKCIPVMQDYSDDFIPKTNLYFFYESGPFKPTNIDIKFFRSTPHNNSGFYSLLSQIPYILRGLCVSSRLSYVPVWTLRYIEYLYNNGHKFSSNFTEYNFKQE